MFIPAPRLAATAILVATLIYPQVSIAEMFTSEEFLTWSREGQGHYFRTAIGMAGLIARQNDEAQGDCIDNWYFNDQDRAHDRITSVMRQYPSYHPRGVILAMIEKACGSMTYK